MELATHDWAVVSLVESLHNWLRLLDPLVAALTQEEAHDGYWAYVLETRDAATAAYWQVFILMLLNKVFE